MIFERARFNRRNQLEGEPAEKYIMELYHLATNCEYGDLTSQDRLVVGIHDEALSQTLQLDPELTLTKKFYSSKRGSQLELKDEPTTMQANQGYPRMEDEALSETVLSMRQRTTPMGEVSSKRGFMPSLQTQGALHGQCQSKVVEEVHTEVYCEGGADSAMLDSAFLGTMDSNQESAWKMPLGQEIDIKLARGNCMTRPTRESAT